MDSPLDIHSPEQKGKKQAKKIPARLKFGKSGMTEEQRHACQRATAIMVRLESEGPTGPNDPILADLRRDMNSFSNADEIILELCARKRALVEKYGAIAEDERVIKILSNETNLFDLAPKGRGGAPKPWTEARSTLLWLDAQALIHSGNKGRKKSILEICRTLSARSEWSGLKAQSLRVAYYRAAKLEGVKVAQKFICVVGWPRFLAEIDSRLRDFLKKL